MSAKTVNSAYEQKKGKLEGAQLALKIAERIHFAQPAQVHSPTYLLHIRKLLLGLFKS